MGLQVVGFHWSWLGFRNLSGGHDEGAVYCSEGGKDNRLLPTVSPRSVHFHKLSERLIDRFREKQGILDIYYVLY